MEAKESGYTYSRWSCGKSTNMMPGDRAFLMKLGKDGTTLNPKGIIGAGEVISEFFVDKHWSGEEHKHTHYVNIKFDVLLNPVQEVILSLDALELIKPELQQQWAPQQSGISIKSAVAEELEELWFNFLKDEHPKLLGDTEEVKRGEHLWEGSALTNTTIRYERNPYARKLCIKNLGAVCTVCDLDFEQMYGDIGKGFIHVHHINPISTQKGKYKINPLKDLVPVCPNCHAMLHRKQPPYKVEDLKERIKALAVG
ncbi:MAG: HNH endonuclease [Hymenobacteraceae bacterium]|nr:HNH endonuclease [Hymenobacteraceae bacterium]